MGLNMIVLSLFSSQYISGSTCNLFSEFSEFPNSQGLCREIHRNLESSYMNQNTMYFHLQVALEYTIYIYMYMYMFK